MKVIKYVIGLVLAITSIGLVANTISKVSTKEVIYDYSLNYKKSDGKLYLNNEKFFNKTFFDDVSNNRELLTITIPDYNIEYIHDNNDGISFEEYGFDLGYIDSSNNDIYLIFDYDNETLTNYDESDIFSDNTIFQFKLSYKSKNTGITYTLISLIPLILVSSVLGVMYYRKRSDY